jgi:uncharacterized Zn finger protein
MSTSQTFDQLLDQVESLTPEDQAELVEVIQRRLAEQGRRRVAADVREARDEFAAGRSEPSSVDDLMRDINP